MTLGTVFKPAGSAPLLKFAGARLPRETFQALRSAEEVLREAEAEAQGIRQRATEAAEEQRQQAHAQGLAQGRAEGLAAVLGTLEAERCLRQSLVQQLADVVGLCIQSLLGEMGAAEVLRQRALHLLSTAATSQAATSGATLYVCPDQLALAQSVVTAARAEGADPHSAALAGLKVVADPNRAPDDLLLETRLGFIESSLSLTLEQTRALLQQALSSSMKQLGALA